MRHSMRRVWTVEVSVQQRRGDRLPLGVERARRRRLAGPSVPVAGVADVAFLAVEVGVDPGARRACRRPARRGARRPSRRSRRARAHARARERNPAAACGDRRRSAGPRRSSQTYTTDANCHRLVGTARRPGAMNGGTAHRHGFWICASRAEGVPGAAAMMLQTCSTRTWPTLRRLVFALAAFAARPGRSPPAPRSPSRSTPPPTAVRSTPTSTASPTPARPQLSDLNVPLNRYGGNTTTPLQLAAQRRQPRPRLVLREHRRLERDAGRGAATRSSPDARAAGAQADDHHPDDRLGREARPEPRRSSPASRSPSTARRPATTGSGSPTPATASARNGQLVTGNDPNDANVPVGLARSSRAGCSTSSAAGARASAGGLRYYILDNEPSIWHSTHRDVHPTGATMDEIRDKMRRLRRARSRPSTPARSSSGPRSGAGAATSTAATTSSTAASTAGATLPDRDGARQRATTCRGSSTSCGSTTPPTGQRLLDVFTRALLPAGRRVQRRRRRRRCSCGATARRARCGTRTTSTRRWINDRVRLIPRLRELGGPRTTRARRSASPSTTGAPRATSTAPRRRPTSSASSAARASTWPRAGRRRPRPRRPTRRSSCTATTTARRSDLRRHQRARDARPTPTSLSAFAAAALERRRAHGDGGQQGAVSAAGHRHAGHRRLRAGAAGRGLAADVGERDHAPRRRRRSRPRTR